MRNSERIMDLGNRITIAGVLVPIVAGVAAAATGNASIMTLPLYADFQHVFRVVDVIVLTSAVACLAGVLTAGFGALVGTFER